MATVRLRQTRVGPRRRRRTLVRSVVWRGTVQTRVTVSPLREARRSCTGWGRSREGGKGTPGVPQPSRHASSRPAMEANFIRGAEQRNTGAGLGQVQRLRPLVGWWRREPGQVVKTTALSTKVQLPALLVEAVPAT